MRSPFAWLAAGLLQLLFGWLFLSAVERFMENQTAATQVISQSVSQSVSQAGSSAGLSSYLIVHFLAPVSIVFMVATPLLCMHLIAGDKQSNRFNFLLSLPVSAQQIVVGKFIGATTFQCLIIAMGAVFYRRLLWAKTELASGFCTLPVKLSGTKKPGHAGLCTVALFVPVGVTNGRYWLGTPDYLILASL